MDLSDTSDKIDESFKSVELPTDHDEPFNDYTDGAQSSESHTQEFSSDLVSSSNETYYSFQASGESKSSFINDTFQSLETSKTPVKMEHKFNQLSRQMSNENNESSGSGESNGNLNSMELPNTSSDLLDSYSPVFNISNFLQHATPYQQGIMMIQGKALTTGRPLGSIIICTFGESNSGKTSTINCLFDDELCHPFQYPDAVPHQTIKQLTVHPQNSQPYTGYLKIVEVPSLLDVNNKHQVENFASVRKLADSLPELQSREELKTNVEAYTSQATVRIPVYPNAILFHLNASENRLLEDSKFKKSLQLLQDVANLIDVTHPNLIICLTNCMVWGGNVDIFVRKYDEMAGIVREVVEEVTGIKNVPVIPVENLPDDYNLQKIDNSYHLPSSHSTPASIFQDLLKMFEKNEDLLAQDMVTWYYMDKCPEKQSKSTVCPLQTHLTNDDLATAYQSLLTKKIAVNKEFGAIPLTLSYLGYGFCPKKEEAKSTSLIPVDVKNLKQENIGKSKILVPKCLTMILNKGNRVSHTFYEKKDYEEYTKALYGLEGLVLTVDPVPHQRWAKPVSTDSTRIRQSTHFHFLREFHMAKLKVNDPNQDVTCEPFYTELHQLPSSFNNNNKNKFHKFFRKWGTHLVYEESVGGYINVIYSVQREVLTKTELLAIQSAITAAIDNLFRTEDTTTSVETEVERAGVILKKIEIDGGVVPEMANVANLSDAGLLQEWLKSVSTRPVELRRSVKLFPYCNLVKNQEHYDSLRQATKDYLSDNTEFEYDVVNMEDVEPIPVSGYLSEAKCFPKGTMITLRNNVGKPIEQLNRDVLMTLKINGTNQKNIFHLDETPAKTQVCTYLHRNVNETAEYLVLHCSNNEKLIVSDGHLIFGYVPYTKCVIVKPAKEFQVGDMLVHKSLTQTKAFETPMVTGISKEVCTGVFCPLTMSGTFLASGFLVSSYANVESFKVAQAATLPLKMWCKLQHQAIKFEEKLLKKKSNDVQHVDGIHPFAEFLLSINDSKKYLA